MIFESIFLIRGGSVGFDWGQKLIYQTKYLFGLNVTNFLWLTIPIQAMAEAGAKIFR